MGKFNNINKPPQQQKRLKVEDTQVQPVIKQNRGEFKSDIPSHISGHIMVDAGLSNSKLDSFMFRLEWKQRTDGVKPQGTEYKYKDLKQVCPGLLMKYLANYIVLS